MEEVFRVEEPPTLPVIGAPCPPPGLTSSPPPREETQTPSPPQEETQTPCPPQRKTQVSPFSSFNGDLGPLSSLGKIPHSHFSLPPHQNPRLLNHRATIIACCRLPLQPLVNRDKAILIFLEVASEGSSPKKILLRKRIDSLEEGGRRGLDPQPTCNRMRVRGYQVRGWMVTRRMGGGSLQKWHKEQAALMLKKDPLFLCYAPTLRSSGGILPP
ncbi:UNVERIFIED_CONTAM: hypothetical protein Sindi_0910800 [Sesamum indicum]